MERLPFVEQIRRHGKDPFAYFEWVFGKLMGDPAPENCPTCCPPHGSKHKSCQ